MKIKTGLVLVIIVSLIFISTKAIFSQEPIVQGGAIPETQTEPEIQWVWGEVVNLDTQSKMILVKYLDYESDQEKEIEILTDDQTSYENVKSFDELKLKDTVSIDYIFSLDGKAMAKYISVEKPEAEKEAPPKPQSGVTETTPTPENLLPIGQ